MDMVAYMKSHEVACKQQVHEHKIRLHNLDQLPNFRRLNFQDKLTLVNDQVFAIVIHRNFDTKLITPRPKQQVLRIPGHHLLPYPQQQVLLREEAQRPQEREDKLQAVLQLALNNFPFFEILIF